MCSGLSIGPQAIYVLYVFHLLPSPYATTVRGSTGREFPERDGTKLVPSRPGNLGREFREIREIRDKIKAYIEAKIH